MTRTIKIEPVLNGYIVTVGCQRVVFDNPTALAMKLQRYLMEPEAMEREYMTQSINRDLLLPRPPEPVPLTMRERALEGKLPEPEPPPPCNPARDDRPCPPVAVPRQPGDSF